MVAKDNPKVVEHIIRVILNRKDISIVSSNVQDDIHFFDRTHSIIVDCLAKDRNGNLYDVEVQIKKEDNLRRRARYISSLIDAKYALEKGKKYKELKENIVIFIMENDIFIQGEQLYCFDRIETRLNLPLNDGSHIIYVNAENKGREELDLLMQSFFEPDYRKMKDSVIRECTMYYKENSEGELKVCEALQAYGDKLYNNGISVGRTEGINIGRTKGINEGTVKTLLSLVSSGNITFEEAISHSGLSKKKFLNIAKNLGYKI